MKFPKMWLWRLYLHHWLGKNFLNFPSFFSHTAERLTNRIKEIKSKISAWTKARLNFALIQSMMLFLRGTKVPSNVDNFDEIDLCAIVAESIIEWMTYRFIPCYFTIMYGYILTCSLFINFLYLYPVIRWYGTHILKE